MAAEGPATGLQAQPNFLDHLFCIWGAHWTTDKMFCVWGTVFETNRRVQVQCSWTAGCPVKWGKSDTAQAERMKREFISLCRTCTVLCSPGQFTHRQKRVCLWVICRDSIGTVCAYIRTRAFFMHFVLERVSTREHVNVLVWEDNLLLQT